MPAPHWTTRLIDAPSEDLMTLAAVGSLLGVSESLLRKLIESGEFPDGMAVGPRLKLWDWRAVTYYRLRLELAPRLSGGTAGGDEE